MRVDSDIRAFRREHRIGAWWPTTERVLACIGPSPSSARVVRAAMRVAQELHAPWTAVSVSAPDAVPMREVDRERLQAHLRLAESLGGEIVMLNGRDCEPGAAALRAGAGYHPHRRGKTGAGPPARPARRVPRQ